MTSHHPDDWVYLRSYMAPLLPALSRHDVTDIFINRPGEIWLEALGGKIERHEVPELDEANLTRFARQVAALNHQGISRAHPLLSASLPGGSRIQIIAPPATRGSMAIAIRKHVNAGMALDDYISAGAFADVKTSAGIGNPVTARVAEHVARGEFAEALRAAVRGRLNILISGGTSSGKTTFLNALLKEVPTHERLILIEDTPEIQLSHDNAVGLLAARSALGEASVTANDLVSASLRMRPDRIILGELRGSEAFAFLRAINTGHPGSMSTIHADTPEGAIEQLALLILEGGSPLRRSDITTYAKSTIGVVVQLERVGAGRRVAAISML
ncbi:P-type DNA transfer ATPase VirB11 [Sphingobium fuliginis]|uniref:Type IV secretion system protein n=1 Tax=Sphingobium fuliginis ATCC 27551 TaxID=1208342 RepID=A0A5B8CE48_SPHSA|nr:P-type DNA transfer ATPase VirB11 [Sphingobium fuliginis]QDC36370.1 P-type DNA transfer ATPase VirB11 [Sphingobium fuliginis ATCC 27551]